MAEQRKRIWIDSFQTGLVVRIALYCLLYQVTSWALCAMWQYVDVALAGLKANGTPSGHVLIRSLLALLILMPPLTLDAIRFAHRFVGPLYRIRKTMQAIAAGEPIRLVQLRKGDMLIDFKDDFNRMLEHLEQQGFVLLKAATPAADAPAHTSSGPHAVGRGSCTSTTPSRN